MYFVYILQCKDRSLYTGITNDISRRLEEHQKRKGGRYTRSHPVERIAYAEEASDRAGALRREAEIKRWPRNKKLDLIVLHSRTVGSSRIRSGTIRGARPTPTVPTTT